jgi:cytochrome d ubiquinol oxidase subunit II
MLLGLVFRGVAFEFRWRDPRHRAFWDWAFSAGSLVAALAQGVTLGALLQGIHVEGRAYAGAWLDWLTPYSLLTGIGVVAGYALLGACWLAIKVEGSAEDKAFRFARIAAWATLALMAGVSLATPFLAHQYFERWFTEPMIFWLVPVPLLTAGIAILLLRAVHARQAVRPFLYALGLFLLGMIGLGVSMWPWVVPQSISIWDAAAPERSQVFMLIGVGLIMPLILAYTGWAYWVFRGKVGEHGYH